MATLVAVRVKAAEVEKKAERLLIVPLLGKVKPKFTLRPEPPVKSILAAEITMPEIELPKPIMAPVPESPPAIVVKVMGRLEAYGIIVGIIVAAKGLKLCQLPLL